MNDNDKPDLWGTEDCSQTHNDSDEAVEAELDGCDPPLPPFLTIHGWAPVQIGMKHGDILDRIMEDLAGDCQWEDGDPIEPSQRVIDAEKELVDAFLADYHPTLCQIVPGHEIEVNVADWVRENAAGWLEEHPDLLSITAESARSISIDHIGLSKEVRGSLRRWRIYDVGQAVDTFSQLDAPEFPGLGLAETAALNALKRIGVHVSRDQAGVS